MRNGILSARMVTATRGEITISGYLYSDKDKAENEIDGMSAKEFKSRLDHLLNSGATEIDILLSNCYGGSVYEGSVIASDIRSCTASVVTKSQGMVASMGFVVFCSAPTRLADAMGVLLSHRAKSKSEGCYERMKDDSENLKTLNDELASAISEMTGMPVEDVHSQLMPRDKDVVINAKEAVKKGIATGTWNSGVKTVIPLKVAAQSDLKAVASFYEAQLNQIYKNTPDMDLTKAAMAIGQASLKDEASFYEAVSKMKTDLDNATIRVSLLEKEKKDAEELAAVTMVANAIKDKKITAAEKDHFEALAKQNFKAVQAILDNKMPHMSANEKLRNVSEENGAPEAKYGRKADESDAQFYGRLTKTQGKTLVKMQSENPDMFKQLKAAYVDSLG